MNKRDAGLQVWGNSLCFIFFCLCWCYFTNKFFCLFAFVGVISPTKFCFFAFVGVISPTKFYFVNNMLQVITPATAKGILKAIQVKKYWKKLILAMKAEKNGC